MKKIIIIVMICMMMFNISIIADAATYDVFKGGFSSCKNLTWNTVDNVKTNEAKKAIAQWNGISSKVKIRQTNSVKANIVLSLGKGKAPQKGLLGQAIPYNGNKIVGSTSRWTKVICLRYKTSGTITNHYATTVHEIGHALSLAHCKSATMHAFHIMHQGLKNSYKVQTYDKNKLIYKWGK